MKSGTHAKTMGPGDMAVARGASGSLPKLVIGRMGSARELPADDLVHAGVRRQLVRSPRRPTSDHQPFLLPHKVLRQ